MDRIDWLNAKRRETEDRYDTLWAPHYGKKWGVYRNVTHQHFLQRFLGLLPQRSKVLDAACGAGRYLPTLLAQDYEVVGIDQSAGMLAQARELHPNVPVEKIALQELVYVAAFEGIICIDAMEHLFPEDWLPVLSNFGRALKPQSYLYFTVELADESDIAAAFNRGQTLGLPLVYGEWADGEVYHYYPSLAQVREWLASSEFTLIEEGAGDGYHHFIACKLTAARTAQY